MHKKVVPNMKKRSDTVILNGLYFEKKNKHPGVLGVETSKYEVAFSNLAHLFMGNLTPANTELIIKNGTITGVKTFDMESQAGVKVQFLDNADPSFETIMSEHLHEVDMNSLACILTSSYLLEEDDLHKGNFGYYVLIDEHGSKHYTFFKIDHDLMMSDSIMSRLDPRFANLLYNKDSFRISVNDLRNFPDLQNSGNHYWPSYERTIVTGEKAYKSSTEREAFKNLKNNPAFVAAKWEYFLRHVTTPTEKIHEALCKGLDPEIDKSKILMIQHSVISRLAELRHYLLATDEFRDYLIQREISPTEENVKMMGELQATASKINDTLHPSHYSPLHVALIMKEYSAGQTSKFKKSELNRTIHHENKLKNPLDIAFENFIYQKNDLKKIINASVLAKLIKAGAAPYDKFALLTYKTALLNYKKQMKVAEVFGINNHEASGDLVSQYETALVTIQEMPITLKDQKKLAVNLFNEIQFSHPERERILKQIKDQQHPYAFIRQLRSNLWIIRKIRGLYGASKSFKKMASITINKRMSALLQNDELKEAIDSLRQQTGKEDKEKIDLIYALILKNDVGGLMKTTSAIVKSAIPGKHSHFFTSSDNESVKVSHILLDAIRKNRSPHDISKQISDMTIMTKKEYTDTEIDTATPKAIQLNKPEK